MWLCTKTPWIRSRKTLDSSHFLKCPDHMTLDKLHNYASSFFICKKCENTFSAYFNRLHILRIAFKHKSTCTYLKYCDYCKAQDSSKAPLLSAPGMQKMWASCASCPVELSNPV